MGNKERIDAIMGDDDEWIINGHKIKRRLDRVVKGDQLIVISPVVVCGTTVKKGTICECTGVSPECINPFRLKFKSLSYKSRNYFHFTKYEIKKHFRKFD